MNLVGTKSLPSTHGRLVKTDKILFFFARAYRDRYLLDRNGSIKKDYGGAGGHKVEISTGRCIFSFDFRHVLPLV